MPPRKRIPKVKTTSKQAPSLKPKEFPGYPMYPASDDIFRRNLEERDIDPEDGSPKERLTRKDQDDYAELDFTEDLSGDDLDVPGSELDDAQEEIGSEDEENNYYSLGGERHDD